MLATIFQNFYLFQTHNSIKIDNSKRKYRNMEMKSQSEIIFQRHFQSWRILGLRPTQKYRKSYITYGIIMSFLFTFGYPLHLMIGLFMSTTLFEILENMAINLTILVCSIKTLVIWWKFANIELLMNIFKKQDQRISLKTDEAYYYEFTVFKNIRLVLKLFFILYFGGWSLCEFSVIFNGLMMGTWDLIFPAYFPFDPFATTINYMLAHLYQFVGITYQIIQEITNDSYLAANLVLLSGQIHTLNMRLTKLGYDPKKSLEENNQELLNCIQDHKDLLL